MDEAEEGEREAKERTHSSASLRACPPLSSSSFSASLVPQMGLTTGEHAPALCDSKGAPPLTHLGEPISLASYAGKRVLIWFYPRASTGG